MQGNARETYGSVNCQGNAGNAGKCQGNIWEWVYSARGMQGTTRGMQGSGCKVPGNEGECRGMPEERTRVEAKCQGNTSECRGIQENTGECQVNVLERVQSARGRLGNAVEGLGNAWEWV